MLQISRNCAVFDTPLYQCMLMMVAVTASLRMYLFRFQFEILMEWHFFSTILCKRETTQNENPLAAANIHCHRCYCLPDSNKLSFYFLVRQNSCELQNKVCLRWEILMSYETEEYTAIQRHFWHLLFFSFPPFLCLPKMAIIICWYLLTVSAFCYTQYTLLICWEFISLFSSSSAPLPKQS